MDGEENYDQQVRLPVLFLLIVVFHGRAEEFRPDASVTQGLPWVHSSMGGPLSGGV